MFQDKCETHLFEFTNIEGLEKFMNDNEEENETIFSNEIISIPYHLDR